MRGGNYGVNIEPRALRRPGHIIATDPDDTHAYRGVARMLAVDALVRAIDELAVRAVGALDAAGIDSLLLRGPVMARWLYDDPAQRPYLDVDLLVPAGSHAAAADAMRRLGLTQRLADAASSERAPHAETFVADTGSVDLHWTIKGVRAAPERVWAAFDAGATELALAGGPVRVPGVPARLLIVALHAAQHGPRGTAREDLRRAVARMGESEWAAAARLAGELEAAPWFAAGLGAVAGGPELLERLAFTERPDLSAVVRSYGSVPLVGGLVTLADTPGIAPKARLLARELVPTASFMREWSPLARRGPWGLAAAYVGRPFRLARRLPGAYRAYRAARRAMDDPPPR